MGVEELFGLTRTAGAEPAILLGLAAVAGAAAVALSAWLGRRKK